MSVNKRRLKGRLAQGAIILGMILAFVIYLTAVSNDWGFWEELGALGYLSLAGTVGTIVIARINEEI